MGIKFTTSKDNLASLLLPSAAVVTNKSTLSSLEGLYLRLSGNTLKVCGYDLEKGVMTEGIVHMEEDGEIVVNASKLVSIVKSMPDCDVCLQADEKHKVIITGESSEFSMAGIAAESYPGLPELSGRKQFIVKKRLLKNLIRKTCFAVSQSDQKPILTGELFKISGNTLTIVAIDYSRLAIREETEAVSGFEDKSEFVVPGKSLNELSKLIPDDDGEVRIELTDKHIIFSYDNVTFFSRLLEGDYMDYERVLPTESKIYVKVKRDKFIESIERVSLFIDEKANTPLKCNFKGCNLALSCFTALGAGNDIIEIEKEGVDIEIGFNYRLLLDALRACDDDTVLIGLNSPKMSALITSTDMDVKKKYQYLVLPCHLKE